MQYKQSQAGKMALKRHVFFKLDNLSSIPELGKCGNERTEYIKLSSDLCMHARAHIHLKSKKLKNKVYTINLCHISSIIPNTV